MAEIGEQVQSNNNGWVSVGKCNQGNMTWKVEKLKVLYIREYKTKQKIKNRVTLSNVSEI